MLFKDFIKQLKAVIPKHSEEIDLTSPSVGKWQFAVSVIVAVCGASYGLCFE
ncbi:hypothetical protein [Listeria seeligeri]|uniref:hypothetical protein n=1 Tax=Listeria seeligeri TaxID=1640 RepID=UPI0016285469|nr:hypothetical protein [Listeria seeligeri]MBC1471813.1 hypothetical protein [Listeria seeligeri]